MKDYEKKNILDTLELLGKLELMLKVTGVESRNLDDISQHLWNEWKTKIKEPS